MKMTGVYVFTSAALNYIPKVRLLFNSIKKIHPEWRTYLALADRLPEDIKLNEESIDEIIPLEFLDIPNWVGWSFCHSIVELATAIKPFMLLKLLNKSDCKKVIYLDPDIVVFSSLSEILEKLEEASVVLTPHQTKEENTLEAVMDNEICSLKHGIYNLGFLGVAANQEGKHFAKWWMSRTYHFCRADISNGLFTDQRWIDLVPALFESVAIIRSSRFNVASWNLTSRSVSIDGDGQYTVDGNPLGFYHFTGFDSGAHEVMAYKNSRGNPTVMKLISWYKKETLKLAKDPLSKIEWSFSRYSDLTPIETVQRIIYRERLDLQNAYKNPYDCAGFLSWFKSQGVIEYPYLNDLKQRSPSNEFFRDLTVGFQNGYDGIEWKENSYSDISRVLSLSRPFDSRRTKSEGILLVLWKVYNHPFMFWIRPFFSKRCLLNLKNIFSKRTIEEIIKS